MFLAAEFLLPGDTSIIEVEAKTEKKSFQNKLNDEFVLQKQSVCFLLFFGLKINDPDHPQAAAVSCSSSGAALSQCQALKGRQRQGMKVSLV